ncbi:uncharacterized protein LOC134884185 isoform X2 [Eleginops maclovinus]|uniref:uncharacterized protein LOC134884185 isoform X2 n=1 Tax=Eleginops maclovinus TaxID=56733 RepID=UPI0030808A4D
MENCGNMFKSVLVFIALVAMVQYGSAEKLDSCCKTVNKKEITDPILGYATQRRNPPCVAAIIFQTEKGYFCSYLNAPWVFPKIKAFNKAKAIGAALKAPSSTASLLSIITSTASPSTRSSSPTPISPSSTPLSSSSFDSFSTSFDSSSSSFDSSSTSFDSSSTSFDSSSTSFPSSSFTSETPAAETSSGN